MERFQTIYASPVGYLILTSNTESLLGIQMHDAPGTKTAHSLPAPLREAIRWLDDYFAGNAPSPNLLPLELTGTTFQQEVWRYLSLIPYGQTVTYGEIAAKIAEDRGIKRMSAQAVGQAVGANPIPIVVPCHRVVGTKGHLVGYACGIDRKLWLLNHEKAK